MDKKHRIDSMSFGSVYALYVQKAEVDEIIAWLTGYGGAQLQRVIDELAKGKEMESTLRVDGASTRTVQTPSANKARYVLAVVQPRAVVEPSPGWATFQSR